MRSARRNNDVSKCPHSYTSYGALGHAEEDAYAPQPPLPQVCVCATPAQLSERRGISHMLPKASDPWRRQQPARSVTDAGTFLAGGAAALLPGEGAAEARSRVFGHETPQHQASRIIQSCESWGGFLLQALGRCASESFHTAAPKPKLLGRGVARRLLFLLHMPYAIRLCLCHTWISKSSSLT